MNASLTSPWLRGAVAEVRDHRRVAVGVAGADRAVALHAHRVAGRVQGLRADDDRVEAEVVLLGVPVAVVDAAEQAEQLERVEAAAPGDAVLAVGREDEVLRAQRAAGADLGGLLAEQLGPDAELAVALQGGRLGVDPADHAPCRGRSRAARRRRTPGRTPGGAPARPRGSAAGSARDRRPAGRGRRPPRDRVRIQGVVCPLRCPQQGPLRRSRVSSGGHGRVGVSAHGVQGPVTCSRGWCGL